MWKEKYHNAHTTLATKEPLCGRMNILSLHLYGVMMSYNPTSLSALTAPDPSHVGREQYNDFIFSERYTMWSDYAYSAPRT